MPEIPAALGSEHVAMGPARPDEISLSSLGASSSQLAALADEVPDYDVEGVLNRTAGASGQLGLRLEAIASSLGVPDFESASQLQAVINTLGSDVDSQLATTSAWSDFHNRTGGRATSIAGVRAVEQMSLNPQALQSKLLGLHSFGLADNLLGDFIEVPAVDIASSELATTQVLVGASCLPDGTHKTAAVVTLIAEGEDGDDDSGIPDVAMPGMVFLAATVWMRSFLIQVSYPAISVSLCGSAVSSAQLRRREEVNHRGTEV